MSALHRACASPSDDASPGPGSTPIRRRADRACPSRSRARSALRDDRSSVSCTSADELRAETAGARRFVHDHAAPGLLHRCRRWCRCRAARWCAGRSLPHRCRSLPPPPSRHAPSCRRPATVTSSPVAHDRRLAERDGVVPIGHFARRDASTTASPAGRDGRRTGRYRCAWARGRSPDRRPRSR